jgi:SAM-dependent methyltransferase
MSPGATAHAAAIERTLDLLGPDRRPAMPRVQDGYLDLLGDADPTGSHAGQRLFVGNVVPRIYERWWRPLGGRVLMGAMGPGMRGEHEIALEMLALAGGERVLDVACGTGAFTTDFARAAHGGLVVGLDASGAMLARAAREHARANVAYVRGDACALPFADASFDAVCCFAALYLIERPLRALEELVRVLAPGGRVALLSSCHRGPLPAAPVDALVRALTGVRIFQRRELTAALRARGLVDVRQRVSGLAQFVSARRPQRAP